MDRFCYAFIASVIPLLFLPTDLLPLGILWAVMIWVYGIHRKQKQLCVLAIVIACCYIRVINFAGHLNQQIIETSRETIKIQRILKMGENPTAIAKRENGRLIYVRWQTELPLLLGQHYLAELRLRPISARWNDGNFNRQRWYIAQHLSATATVKSAEHQVIVPDMRTAWFERVRTQTQESEIQGILLALAFGERAWLKAEHWELFRQTATAHLIAISGLHIALAAGIGFFFTKGIIGLQGWVCYRFKYKQAVYFPYFFALLGGLLTAWSYSFLAGFAIPTIRAALAVSLVFICQWRRHYYTAWQFWLRCVVLLILIDPLTLLSESFWLSVLAVASLIFWYRYFPLTHFKWLHIWQKQHWILHFVIKLVHLQLGIALCFLPIQLYFFHGVSPFAFAANLLIVPVYSLLVIPLILWSLLSDNLLQSWTGVAWLIALSVDILKPLAKWQPLSLIQQWQLLSIDVWILALLYWRKQLKSHLSILVVACLAFYQVGIYWFSKAVFEIEWRHFDVGQGLAMAFIYFDEQGRKRAVLYDTGSSWQGGSMAELEIIPYLRRQGIVLESIILSHDDNDHAGGVLPLLNAYPNAMIISPSQQYRHLKSEPCVSGQQWQFGALRLKAVFPAQQVIRATNTDSCVLVGEIGRYRLLLTGDSHTDQEQIFAEQVGKIDFLQVGHHGSKTSTGYTLLSLTQPHYALISTGRFNPWRMPNQQVLARLENSGVTYFNTAQTGMINIQFSQRDYQLSFQRDRWTAWYASYLGK